MTNTTFSSHIVRTGAFNTRYIEAGAGDPLVLIHGGGPGADCIGNWSDCIPYFAEKYRVLAYDMVGFGGSDSPDPATFEYSMAARAQQLNDFMDALGISGQASVIGNSMGGATALGAIMVRPELVRNLVLMGSAGLTRSLPPAAGKLMHYDFTLDGMRQVAVALAYPGFALSEERIRYRYDLTLDEKVRRGTEATQKWVKDNGGLFYEEDLIAAIKTRTLVLHGKNDPVVPLEIAYKFLDLLENSYGAILPQCGHWAMLEHPEIFCRICLGFLDQDRAG